MKIYYILFFLYLFFLLNNGIAQSVTKADALMKDYKYAEAISELKPLADKGNTQAIRKIAECYRKINDYQNAEKYYSIVVVDKNINPKNYLYYGQILMNNNKYDEALSWLNKYMDTKLNAKDSIFTENLIVSCFKSLNNAEVLRKIKFENLSTLNSEATDFCAIDYNDKIIFTSAREGKKNGFDGQSFAHVYIATPKNDTSYKVELMSGAINSKNFNSGPASVNIKNNIIYYTKNNIQYGESNTNKKGDVTLKVFEAKIGETNSKGFSEMQFNDAEYSSAYPAINKAGNKIYYTSDRGGGYGGKDIYYSVFKDGKWSKPKNAGNIINTSGDEKFPFVHDDGTLYFSSNGHSGFGGLDIFQAVTNDSGSIIEIKNMGMPFNSSADDFGFYLDSTYRKGYVSSNRTGGKGSDDIYAFYYEDIPLTLEVYHGNKALDSVKFIIENKADSIELYSDHKGIAYTFVLANSNYKITVQKDGFIFKEIKLKTYDLFKPISKKIYLEELLNSSDIEIKKVDEVPQPIKQKIEENSQHE